MRSKQVKLLDSLYSQLASAVLQRNAALRASDRHPIDPLVREITLADAERCERRAVILERRIKAVR